jgi:hypothetical protein
MATKEALAFERTLFSVEQLRWVNRIILVSADQQGEAEVISQLRQAKSKIDERHLLWFVFSAERLTSNYEGEISQSFVRDIHHKYFNNQVKFVLIGKDGGIKDQQPVLRLNSTLALIDIMPMRQSETK